MLLRKKYYSKRLIFQTFTEELISKEYLLWFNNKDRLKYTNIKNDFNLYDSKKYISSNLKSKSSLFIHVSSKEDKKIIGTMRLSNFFSDKKIFVLSLLIGLKKHSNRGFGKEIINIGKKICKDLDNSKYISASIEVGNISSIICFLKSDFIIQKLSKDKSKFGYDTKQVTLVYKYEKN